MLITNHVAQGAIIGALAPGPASAFVTGVGSHFAADWLPHWGGVEPDAFLRVAVADGLAGLAAMGWLASRAPAARRGTVLAGMLGACFPDADKPSTLFFGRSPFPRAMDRWHERIQHEEPRRMPQEVARIVVGVALATWVVGRYRTR
ncbi:MAG: hypothetical protein JOZ82_09275 [Marmoricola sp.]|nr:hypothetical protein [Marmoricola sp.]